MAMLDLSFARWEAEIDRKLNHHQLSVLQLTDLPGKSKQKLFDDNYSSFIKKSSTARMKAYIVRRTEIAKP